MTSSYQPDALELVRALVRDKTRFEPADLQPAGGADSFQPLLLSARYSLAARRASGAINGASFAPADDDVRSASVATVESDADWEDHGRLAQAQDLLARQLAADGSAWDAIGDGVYLGHHRRHWHLASCEACHGRGRVECATCHGSRAVPCDACAGGGRMRCPDCPPGNRKCPTCHGSKQVACGECLGDGAVACGACAGAGEVQCAPCAGSGRYGLAAWVDIHLGVEYNLALPDTADADVRAIAAAGPHAIAAVAHTLVLRHVEPGAGGQLRADYALQLRVVRQDVACNGHVYQLLAYGYPLTWHTLGGIVEDLLRHDLQALDHALGAAKRQGWLATDTGALLPPLHAVTASALNLEVAEALLDGTQTHGAVVSSNYADELRTTVLGALRQVHARVARRTWWHGALAEIGRAHV